MKFAHAPYICAIITFCVIIYNQDKDRKELIKQHDSELNQAHLDGWASKVCPPPQEPSIEQCMIMWFGHKPTDFATSRQRICGK